MIRRKEEYAAPSVVRNEADEEHHAVVRIAACIAAPRTRRTPKGRRRRSRIDPDAHKRRPGGQASVRRRTPKGSPRRTPSVYFLIRNS